MRSAGVEPTASWLEILREQLRATRLCVQREVIVIAGVLTLVTVVVLVSHATAGTALDFSIEMALPVVIVGLFAPMAVWKEEEPFRRSYFWALPVHRAGHTLVKVFDGWVWLMILIVAYMVWGLSLALVTGGEIGVEEMRLLMGTLPDGVRPTAADYYTHRQITPAWQWLVPFTGATAMYLLGSIVVLGSDRPWRWFAAIFFSYMLFLVLSSAAELRWLADAVLAVQQGRYGLEMLLTGSEDMSVAVTTPAGTEVDVWLDRPRADFWLGATLLWTGIGALGVLATAFRHQER